MDKTAYDIGVEAALADAGLTKNAGWLGAGKALISGAGRLGEWGASLGRSGGIMKPMFGTMAKNFAEDASTLGKAWAGSGGLGSKVWATMKAPMVRDVGINTVVGGAMGAGTAKPGERMQGAASGAGWGAVGGVAFGGISSAAKGFRAAPAVHNFMNAGTVKGWAARQATRPGLLAMAATMALPTGMAHGGGGAAQAAGPGVAMSNLATNVQ